MPSCRDKAATVGVAVLLVSYSPAKNKFHFPQIFNILQIILMNLQQSQTLCVGCITLEALEYSRQSYKNDIIKGLTPFPSVNNSKFSPEGVTLNVTGLSAETVDTIYLFFTKDLTFDKVYIASMVLFTIMTICLYSFYLYKIKFFYFVCHDQEEVEYEGAKKCFTRSVRTNNVFS